MYLTEIKLLLETPDVDSAIAVIIKNLVPSKYPKAEFVKKAGEILSRALAAKHIWNVDYVESKETLSRAVSQAEENVSNDPEPIPKSGIMWQGTEETRFDRILYSNNISPFGINEYPKALRGVNALLSGPAAGNAHFNTMLSKYKQVLEAGIQLRDIYKILKPYVEKGRKPKEVDPNAPPVFHSISGSKDSQDRVEKELKKLISPLLDKYETNIRTWFTEVFEEYKDRETVDVKNIGEFTLHAMRLGIHLARAPNTGWNDRIMTVTVLKDAKARIKEAAKKDREEVEKSFLHKNIRKISAILDTKPGGLTKVVPDEHTIHMQNGYGRIEAGLRFEFTDKAHFNVVTKIIHNRSARGLRFPQYPTTFHDVVRGDGSKLASPSEEKMVKDFHRVGK